MDAVPPPILLGRQSHLAGNLIPETGQCGEIMGQSGGNNPANRFSRRTALKLGATGLGSLAWLWADWLRAAPSAAGKAAKAKSVILIFNAGAPSHIDLWDPKPNASDTVRGEFKPISTNVPGIQISE